MFQNGKIVYNVLRCKIHDSCNRKLKITCHFELLAHKTFANMFVFAGLPF